MIRVNWKEAKNLDKTLRAHNYKIVTFHVYFHNVDGQLVKLNAQVKFEDWLNRLFEVESRQDVVGIVIKDDKSNLLWKIQARDPIIESVRELGHEHVVRDFTTFEPYQRAAWTKMVTAAIQDHVNDVTNCKTPIDRAAN